MLCLPPSGEQDRKDDPSDEGDQHLSGVHAADHGHDEQWQCGLQQDGFFPDAQYQHDQSGGSPEHDTEAPEGKEESAQGAEGDGEEDLRHPFHSGAAQDQGKSG